MKGCCGQRDRSGHQRVAFRVRQIEDRCRSACRHRSPWVPPGPLTHPLQHSMWGAPGLGFSPVRGRVQTSPPESERLSAASRVHTLRVSPEGRDPVPRVFGGTGVHIHRWWHPTRLLGRGSTSVQTGPFVHVAAICVGSPHSALSLALVAAHFRPSRQAGPLSTHTSKPIPSDGLGEIAKALSR